MDCIFCRIAKGEIDSAKIWEDEKILAFLDINPLTRGHCLIIPKEHFENIFDLDKDILKEIIVIAKEISEKMKRSLGAKGVNLLNSNGKEAEQLVFHFHLHIVPRYENDGRKITTDRAELKVVALEELKKLAEEVKLKVAGRSDL
ncbi:MAG: Hit-like protein involved in cell-cycle regulation [Parcubacteria group bacterium Licking1014_1]|nr:MAG: Hit-like protein involved in cell-cycle regulation [Parcubacteria group bacterium Licking1014_1]